MNGAKARKIRKMVYGERSKRNERLYVFALGLRLAPNGLRAKYQAVKKIMKMERGERPMGAMLEGRRLVKG